MEMGFPHVKKDEAVVSQLVDGMEWTTEMLCSGTALN